MAVLENLAFELAALVPEAVAEKAVARALETGLDMKVCNPNRRAVGTEVDDLAPLGRGRGGTPAWEGEAREPEQPRSASPRPGPASPSAGTRRSACRRTVRSRSRPTSLRAYSPAPSSSSRSFWSCSRLWTMVRPQLIMSEGPSLPHCDPRAVEKIRVPLYMALGLCGHVLAVPRADDLLCVPVVPHPCVRQQLPGPFCFGIASVHVVPDGVDLEIGIRHLVEQSALDPPGPGDTNRSRGRQKQDDPGNTDALIEGRL